jgi:hypothetical protein
VQRLGEGGVALRIHGASSRSGIEVAAAIIVRAGSEYSTGCAGPFRDT